MEEKNNFLDTGSIQNSEVMNSSVSTERTNEPMEEYKSSETVCKNDLELISANVLTEEPMVVNEIDLQQNVSMKNTSLRQLMSYHSSEDSESDSSESTGADSNSDSDSDSDSDSESDPNPIEVRRRVLKPPRVRGELTVNDLPPVQDLNISVSDEECVEIGKVFSIVDTLVCVQSYEKIAAIDLDSVLFLEKGNKPMGKVFDVIGKVSSPIYCVRFNSNEDIKEKHIEIGVPVYIAPKSSYTSYIFLPDLLKVKGSDASWENDVEPPPKYIDYSDDEEERNARKSHQKKEDDAAKKLQTSRLPNLNKRARPSIGLNRGSTNQAQINNRGIRPASFRPPAYNFPQPTPYYNSNGFVPHQQAGQQPLFNMSVPPPPIAVPHFGGVPQQRQQMLPNPFNPYFQNQPSFGVQTPWTNVPFMNQNTYTQPIPPHQNMYGAPPYVYNGHPPTNIYSASAPPNVYSPNVPSHIYSVPPPSNSFNMPPPPPPGTF